MQVTITVNNYSFTIDSIDPEILGKWFVEIFERTKPNHPSDQVYVRIYPSFVLNKDGVTHADWIQDSRYLDTLYNIRTPRQLAEAITRAVENYEESKNAESHT